MYYSRTMHVMTSQTSVPDRTTVAIEAVAIVATTVTAIIGNPNGGTAVVEITAIVIAVDGEVPTASTPQNRTQEVVGCRQKAVLPVVQNAAKVVQTIGIVAAIKVGRRINPQEIVEVDLVCVIILLVVEVELIRHLVRQVESLCLSTLETHCADTHPGCHHHQGKN